VLVTRLEKSSPRLGVKKSLKGTVYLDGSEKPPEVCTKEEKGGKGKLSGTPGKIFCRAFYRVGGYYHFVEKKILLCIL
jgi:hypothetical protein